VSLAVSVGSVDEVCLQLSHSVFDAIDWCLCDRGWRIVQSVQHRSDRIPDHKIQVSVMSDLHDKKHSLESSYSFEIIRHCSNQRPYSAVKYLPVVSLVFMSRSACDSWSSLRFVPSSPFKGLDVGSIAKRNGQWLHLEVLLVGSVVWIPLGVQGHFRGLFGSAQVAWRDAYPDNIAR
jgi:hypothetical protein